MSAGCAMRSARLPPRGFTLLEMMVVMAILGLTVGMTGLAFLSLRARRGSELIRELNGARAQAIESGRPVVSGSNRAPRTAQVLFLPDGRAIGAGVDPLTGSPLDSAH